MNDPPLAGEGSHYLCTASWKGGVQWCQEGQVCECGYQQAIDLHTESERPRIRETESWRDRELEGERFQADRLWQEEDPQEPSYAKELALSLLPPMASSIINLVPTPATSFHSKGHEGTTFH